MRWKCKRYHILIYQVVLNTCHYPNWKQIDYVPWKMRKEVAVDLKRLYANATADEAEQPLAEFEAKWNTESIRRRSAW